MQLSRSRIVSPAALLAASLLLAIAGAARCLAEDSSEHLFCGTLHLWHDLNERGAAAYGPGGAHFDEHTGSDVFNFAPDRFVDITHMDLELEFSRLWDEKWSGVARYEFVAFDGADRIVLDASALDIEEVDLTLDGDSAAVEWLATDEQVTIKLPRTLSAGEEGAVTLRWTGEHPSRGLYFILPAEQYAERPTQVWTQGQTNTNQHWFPTYDSPNERFTSATAMRVPAGMLALSNGRAMADDWGALSGDEWLAAKADPATTLSRFSFHQEINHPAYLVSMVLGDLVVVRNEHGGIELEDYVWAGQEEAAAVTFRNTAAMLDAMESWTGHRYPYPKYAHAVVFNFTAGGMENISASTLYESALIDDRLRLDRDMDGLIGHELAHQWFGDWLTCRTWQHIWLNEGFATYFEMLCREAIDGEDMLYERLWDNHHSFADADDPAAGNSLFHPDYSNNWDVFGSKGGFPYPKGSWVLHMMRRSVGDDMFRAIMREYVDRHNEQPVETIDLRKVAEDLTGRDWDWFFTQWVTRSGTPQLEMSFKHDIISGEATLRVEQTQTITRDAPAFRLPMNIWFRFADGSERVESIEINERTQTFRWALDALPVAVAPNPRASTLAKIDWKASSEFLLETALDGPTVYAKLIAVAAFENVGNERAGIDGLAAVMADASVPYRVRIEAARVLGRMYSIQSRDVLLDWLGAEKVRMAIERPAQEFSPREAEFARVRTAVYEALAGYRGPLVEAAFVDAAERVLAEAEPSYYTEAAIAAGLTAVAFEGHWETIYRLAERPSWYDRMKKQVMAQLRGVNAVRSTEYLEAIDWVSSVAQPGHADRTRADAVKTYTAMNAKFDRHERGTAFDQLVAWTTDSMWRVRRTAIGQLGALDATGSRGVLQAMAGSSDPDVADEAQGALDGMTGRIPFAVELSALREEVDLLRKERETIEELKWQVEMLRNESGLSVEDLRALGGRAATETSDATALDSNSADSDTE